MNGIKNIIVSKAFLVCALLFSLIGSLDAMRPNKFTYTVKSKSTQQPVLTNVAAGRSVGLKMVWVRTSDKVLVEVPLWQIEQMTVLYEEFARHYGKNSAENPIDASLLSLAELTLLQETFQKMESGLLKPENIYVQQKIEGDLRLLIVAAGKVGAYKLSALLVQLTVPKDINVLIELDIIDPVVSYLKDPANGIINLVGHKNKIRCLDFSPNSKFFVSGSDGAGTMNNLILWDGVTLQQKEIFTKHKNAITCLAISPDSHYCVTGSHGNQEDNNLILWDFAGKSFKKLGSTGFFSSTGHSYSVTCVAFSPDGKSIVSGSRGSLNNLIVWDTQLREQKYVLPGHIKDVTCVAFSPDGNYIASGSRDKTVMLWSAQTGELLHIFTGHLSPVICLAFDYDSTTLISGSAGTVDTLIAHSIKTKEEKALITPSGTAAIDCIVFSPNKRHFLVGGALFLGIFDLHTEKLIKSFPHFGLTQALVVSYDSRCFAAGSTMAMYKKNIMIGSVAQEGVSNLFHVAEHPSCLAFNPHDSYTLIIGSAVDQDNLHCLKLYEPAALDYIATKLTVTQAHFLYRLYKAKKNNDIVVLDKKDQDYAVYNTLPFNVRKLIRTFFPFKVGDLFFPFGEKSQDHYELLNERAFEG